jgi:hypothetical protein
VICILAFFLLKVKRRTIETRKQVELSFENVSDWVGLKHLPLESLYEKICFMISKLVSVYKIHDGLTIVKE